MAESKLAQYFPLIRTRREVMDEIQCSPQLKTTFDDWPDHKQEEFLDFCTGTRGVKMVYDAFFKELMNPETTPERMEDFLSLILEQNVTVLMVLPNDGTRIANESALLTTDIVVELADGSIANVEIQKIGYAFSGERSACYSADLLLRQYKRVRSQKGKKFHYRDIKRVYTIILFEHSPKIFHSYPQNYIHRFSQKSDTGLPLELLQEYIFLPLDIYRNIYHNKGIHSKREAWLAFFILDEPEAVIDILTSYPEFKPMYEQIYEICRNMEKVMGIFSKELLEMDRNAAQYMMDEMQKEIDQQKAELSQVNAELNQVNAELNQANAELNQANAELNHANAELNHANAELNHANAELNKKDSELKQKDSELEDMRRRLQDALRQIQENN